MAGDWIKLESVTPDKPEVHDIAERLEMDPDAVVGKLVRIWIWADQQTFDGNARSVSSALLDRLVCVNGFAEAMLSAGWLDKQADGYTFPNFDRHNGQTAKQRALTAKRVAKHKAQKGNDASVTSALPREEKSIRCTNSSCLQEEKKPRRKRFQKPTVAQVAEYCAQRKNRVNPDQFVDFYESKGWKVGNQPMKCWKSAVRTWERSEAKDDDIIPW